MDRGAIAQALYRIRPCGASDDNAPGLAEGFFGGRGETPGALPFHAVRLEPDLA
jgi:hypothetical protein